MLELNQPNAEEIHVKDVNEETFMDDVIEASKIHLLLSISGHHGVVLVKP